MSTNFREQEIAGTNVMVTEFPALKKARMQYRVTRVVGPLFASSVGALFGAGTNVEDASIDTASLAGGIRDAFETLDEQSYENLIADMLHSTRFGAKSLNSKDKINEAFVGEGSLATMYRVLAFVWEVNFGPLPIGRIISNVQEKFSALTKTDSQPINEENSPS